MARPERVSRSSETASRDLVRYFADVGPKRGHPLYCGRPLNRVELRGVEPLTYSMRTSRATNCATAPVRRARLSPGT
jgi:hypothetical protein